jgi:hypothetical protein
MKTCTKCLTPKDDGEFSTKTNGRLMSWCKKCCSRPKGNLELTESGYRVFVGEARAYNQAAQVRELLARLAR